MIFGKEKAEILPVREAWGVSDIREDVYLTIVGSREEAMEIAKKTAQRGDKLQAVYKLTLVGIAKPVSANYAEWE